MSDHEYVERVGRPRRGARDGNDRTARIGRWLATKPIDLVQTLSLEIAGGGEDPELVASWPRSEVTIELAFEINRLIEDAADDRGSTVSALLFWAKDDGARWLSKSFRASCSEGARENVRPLDGTVQSLVSQLQRHNEAYAAQLATMTSRQDERWERVLGLYERTIEKLVEQRESAEQIAEAARLEADQAVELANEAAAEAERAAAAAQDAQEQDTLGKVVEIGLKQLTGGK